MNSSPHLTRAFGFRNMLTLSFGAIVGIGWIPMLGGWLAAGSLGAVAAFVVGGAAMVLVALCYAESATSLPASGGDVVYAHEAFGAAAAFGVGWLLLLIYVAVNAFMAVSTVWIVSVVVPSLGCGSTDRTILGIDVNVCNVTVTQGGMLALLAINILGARVVAAAQDMLTLVLVLATAAFVVAGFTTGDPANLRPWFAAPVPSAAFAAFGAVLATTPLWYAGFNVVPQAMGERARGLPVNSTAWAMVLGIVGAILFYCAVIVAAAMSMPRTELLAAHLPMARAIETALGSQALAYLILCAALGGVLTSLNAALFSGARVLMSLGRAGLLPRCLARVHQRHGSPHVALTVVAVCSMVMALPGRMYIDLFANAAGVGFCMLYAFACVTALRLRFVLRNHTRPFMTPGGPVVPLLAVITAGTILAVALVNTGPRNGRWLSAEWALLLAWAAAGWATWRWSARSRAGSTAVQRRDALLGAK